MHVEEIRDHFILMEHVTVREQPTCPKCNAYLSLAMYHMTDDGSCIWCRNRLRVAYGQPVEIGNKAYTFEAVG